MTSLPGFLRYKSTKARVTRWFVRVGARVTADRWDIIWLAYQKYGVIGE